MAMESRIKRLSICLVLPVFLSLLFGCKKYEGGFSATENPQASKSSHYCFRLEEEIRFGGDSGLSRIEYDVDEDGNVYVLDRVENNIRIYDPQGTLRARFGKKGQGPGEFGLPVALLITIKDELMVQDVGNSQLKYFSKSGEYLRQSPLSRFGALVLSMKVAPNGDFIALLSHNPWSSELKRFDHDLSASKSITSLTRDPEPPNQVDLSRPEIEYAVDKDSSVIFGLTDKYELTVAGADGRTLRKITRAHATKPFPEYERKRLEDQMRSSPWFGNPSLKIIYPKYEPAFDNIVADDTGRYFVLVFGPKEKNILDVFTNEGAYLGNAELPRRTSAIIIKKGKLYGIDYNDEGYPTLRRYGIIWRVS